MKNWHTLDWEGLSNTKIAEIQHCKITIVQQWRERVAPHTIRGSKKSPPPPKSNWPFDWEEIDWAEFSNEEIAELQGCSPSTARYQRIQRAPETKEFHFHPHHSGVNWSRDIDWSKSDTQIQKETGVHMSAIHRHRKKHDPDAAKKQRKHTQFAPDFWDGIDWSKTNQEISAETGRDHGAVSQWRRKLAPETVGKTRAPKRENCPQPLWEEIDWSLTTKEIADQTGCSQSLVSQWRRKLAPETLRNQGPKKLITPKE